MSKLIDQSHRAAWRLTHYATQAVHALRDTAKRIWERHLELMDDEPAYRAQVVAGATAVLTVLALPRTATAGILAALGLHAAAHGSTTQPRPAYAWEEPRY